MITEPADEAIFVSVKEAAAKMTLSAGRVYQLIANRELPAIKRGRRVLIPTGAFQRFIDDINRQALENLNEAQKGQPDV